MIEGFRAGCYTAMAFEAENSYPCDEDMTGPIQSAQISAEDEIDLRELLSIFWRRRLLLLITALLFAIGALIVSLVIPKKYTANILLAPVSEGSGGLGGGGSVLSQYRGLAALAGFASPEDERKSESIALLKSTVITEDFIQQNNLLPVLFGSRWDATERRWRAGAKVPTLWEGSQYFEKKIRTVTEDTKTSLVTVSINWRDAAEAASWANGLVKLTNEYSREKDIAIAQRDIAFLNQQATQTPYVEEHQAISSILENELTKEMLAKGTDEYALKVIDPAFVPERPSFPRPSLWTVLGFLAGIFAGCCYALVRHKARPNTGSASDRLSSEVLLGATKRESIHPVTGSS